MLSTSQPLLENRIPELLRRVDLFDLVAERAGHPASNSGGASRFHCRRHLSHDDRKPSFTVQDGRWRCWSSCATGGDAIDLLVWLDGITKAEAIELLGRRVGLERQQPQPRPAPRLDSRQAALLLDGYMKRRNLPPEIAEELDLSIVLDKIGHPRVRHPLRLRNEVVGWQDRALDPNSSIRWLSSPGPIRCPYEANRIQRAEEVGEVVVCEGVSDVVAIIAAFENPAVVGIAGCGWFKAEWVPAFTDLDVTLMCM
jgi:DNA primase